MNDFLQALRNSHADRQRPPMTRKHYDEAFHNTLPQYQHVNQTVPAYQHPNQAAVEEREPSRLEDLVMQLNEGLQVITDQQKHLIYAQEKTADMVERQVMAFERILDHLNI